MEIKTELFNFWPLGQAIKKARNDNNWTREQLAGMLGLSPRYLVDIENEGQHPSLQVLYSLAILFDISVDQFFFPDKNIIKDTPRRQLDSMLDDMDGPGIVIMTATAEGIKKANTDGE